MGASSGKLVINSHNLTNNAKPEQPADGNLEAASQETPTIVNGHAEGEQTREADDTTENQANGDVSATDSKDKVAESTEKIQKKQKSSIIRIPHRLSKINFSFNLGGKKRSKTSTSQEPEALQETQITEQNNDESAISGVADSLVQEVIESATEVHTTSEEQKEVPQSPEAVSYVTKEVIAQSPPTLVTESPIEVRPDVQEISQQLDTEISVVSDREEVITNGDHEINGKINNHVIDFNNTNSTTFEYVNGDSHPVCDNDAIVSKLANLELTNGHSDHVVDVPIAINAQD